MRVQRGLSLIEMLVALVIGLGLILILIRLLISGFNHQQIQSQLQLRQENGRYFLSRLRHDIEHIGFYQASTVAKTPGVDLNDEARFVDAHPIILPGDVPFDLHLGTQSVGNGSDELVVAFQSDRDCRGFKLGYAEEQSFWVVNRYFVADSTLYCVGYDGRVLLQQKDAQGHNRHSRVALLEQVYQFKVRFMLVDKLINESGVGVTQVSFVTPSALIDHPDWVTRIGAVQLGCILQAQLPPSSATSQDLFFMGQMRTVPNDEHRYATFETVVALANVNQPSVTVSRGNP